MKQLSALILGITLFVVTLPGHLTLPTSHLNGQPLHASGKVTWDGIMAPLTDR